MLSLWTNPLVTVKSKADSKMSPKNYFDRLFDDTFETMTRDLFYMPNLGIESKKSEDGTLMVSMEVPGIKESDLSVEILDNLISVKGEKKTNISSHKVQKSFTIPEGYDCENIEASLNDGILNLSLKPSQPVNKEIKKIPIKSSG